MASVTDEYISNIVGYIASLLNLDNYTYTKRKFENIGQNYFGIIVPIVIVGTCDDEEVRTPLVLKLAPTVTDERFQVSGAIAIMFAREIYVYSTLLSEYEEQQQALALSPFIAPKCFYVCEENCREAIVLQDMSADGYKTYTQSFFLDFNHIVVSLKSLANFHANSFILKQRNSELFDEALNMCPPMTEKTNKRFIEVLGDRICKAIQNFGETKYGKMFEQLQRQYVELVEATSNSVKNTCICHGDMWKENILFKYEDCGAVVSACLIDYQTARVSSPAYDVLYLIATSSDSALRHQHFYELLNIYYQHFESTMKQAGFNTEDVYSQKSFEKDLQTVAPACLVIANTAMWLANGLQQEGHVKSKVVLSTEAEKLAAMDSYKMIIKGIIDDFGDYNYLSIPV